MTSPRPGPAPDATPPPPFEFFLQQVSPHRWRVYRVYRAYRDPGGYLSGPCVFGPAPRPECETHIAEQVRVRDAAFGRAVG